MRFIANITRMSIVRPGRNIDARHRLIGMEAFAEVRVRFELELRPRQEMALE